MKEIENNLAYSADGVNTDDEIEKIMNEFRKVGALGGEPILKRFQNPEDFQNVCPEFINAWRELNGKISMDEFRFIKEKMKLGKSGGIDGVPMEVFLGERKQEDLEKGGPLKWISAFDSLVVDLFNLIPSAGIYPEAWRVAILVKLLMRII